MNCWKKVYLFFVSCCLCAIACNAKQDVYSPLFQKGYGNASIVCVIKNDSSLILKMQSVMNPGDELWIPPCHPYLSDEYQRLYSLKYAEGIVFGKVNVIPYSGILNFSLVFDSVPKDVDFLDLLWPGCSSVPFAFWGIHKNNSKIPAPKFRYENVNLNQRLILDAGKSLVRGKIEGYKAGGVADTLSVCSVVHVNHEVHRTKCISTVDSLGQFEFNLSLENTMWLYVEGRQLHLPVLVNPGDTVEIFIKRLGEYDMRTEYVSYMGHDVMNGLMQAEHGLSSLDLHAKSKEKIRPIDLHEDMVLRKASNKKLCDYLTWKYNLTAIEAHLLLLSMNSVVDGVAVLRLNNDVKETYLHFPGSYLQPELLKLQFVPEITDSYDFLSNICVKDYSYFVLPDQYLLTYLPKIEIVHFTLGFEKRLKVLEAYLKQSLDEEWRKRICF